LRALLAGPEGGEKPIWNAQIDAGAARRQVIELPGGKDEGRRASSDWAFGPATFPRSNTLLFSRSTTLAEGGTMFVSDILSQKGGLVFSVTPATTVAEVAKQLSVRRIGSVLILNEHSSVVGIVSERDLVRAIAAHGDKAMELEARQVMTRDVVTCHPDDSIEEVMQAMTKGRFRHLPVVDRGELLGLVSIGDVVKARLEETEHETEALKAYIVAG
jgi:CBS domain-containing protein